MADSEPNRPTEAPNDTRGGNSWTEWLRPRRVFGFLHNIVRWEASMRRLEEENRVIRGQILDIEKEIAAQDAKLQLLVGFVKDSLNERIDMRTELVVRQVLDRDPRSKGE